MKISVDNVELLTLSKTQKDVIKNDISSDIFDEVVFVLPNVTALMAPPVANDTVVADASLLIASAPVPEFIVNAPFVAVTLSAPEPDWTVVADVVLVLPRVTPLMPPPVANDTVVAEASVDIPNAPVPLLIVKAPLVDVTFNTPEPDCKVVADVVFVLPKVEVLTPPPVATVTVVAAASLDIDNAPVPEFTVIAPFVAVILSAPLPL